MRRVRRITAVMAVALLTTGGTVAYADDEPDTTTTTEVPQPVVTIKVEDVPAPEPEKTLPAEDTAAPTTADSQVTEQPATSAPSPVAPSEETPSTAAVTATTNVQVTSSEEAVVTGTQVANADTGNNSTHTEGNTPATGGQQPNDIDTGGATAVGSDDTNVVDQEAAVVLTEQAVANLLQVALVLNIGAALANSGVNGAVSTPGGTGITGAIDSGNATAIGNDMEQYITQAARANADGTTDDAAKQLAVSLWMGLANANSGVNASTGDGTTGSGGGVGTGDASATGNQSITDILQQASLNGSGTGQLNVEQYATVMNIGFALANSGVNDISGVAGGLLTAGTSEEQNGLALDLFSMLLPALMQSFVGTSGSGTIGTGDATAIGNRSETYIHQLAEAAASGDGIASIIQDVLVANVGAAGANTGGNVLGGRYANLDPDQAKAVVTLAAFLSQMLALVHTQSASTALAMQQAGMEIPFGSIVLQVQGQMQGYDTTIDGPTGQRANIRQITIILSLGIAEANSGLNEAIGVDQDNQLAARVVGDPSQLTATGDALAANDGMIIICQRRNADDIECLAPPPPPVPDDPATPPTTVPAEVTTTTQLAAETGTEPTTTLVAVADSSTHGQQGGPQGFTIPAPQTSHSSTLPSTGSSVADIMLWAGFVLLLGFGLMVGSHRRRQVQPVLVTGGTHPTPDHDLWSLVPHED